MAGYMTQADARDFRLEYGISSFHDAPLRFSQVVAQTGQPTQEKRFKWLRTELVEMAGDVARNKKRGKERMPKAQEKEVGSGACVCVYIY